MGKKANNKEKSKKMTKKEKKAQTHLKLIKGKKGSLSSVQETHTDQKKAS